MSSNSGELEDFYSGMPRGLTLLAAVVVAAFCARLLFIAIFPQTLTLDASGYDSYAFHLLEGNGYTRFDNRSADTYLPPLYPAFLALIYFLLGRGPIQVAVIQALLDCVTMYLLYLIGRRVAGHMVGVLSAAFYGFYPYLLFQNLSANDTGLFILLLATGIWLSYKTRDRHKWQLAAVWGGVIGLAAMTKPWISLVLPLIFMWWIKGLGGRLGASLASASLITSLLVISPWVVHNSLLHDELVFISTNDGTNLYQGNNACVAEYLRRGWDAQWVDCLATAPAGLDETAQNRWFRQQAVSYIKENPAAWAELAIVKLTVLWNPRLMPTSLPPDAVSDDDPVKLYHTPLFNFARRLHTAYYGPLLLLGCLGLFIGQIRGFDISPLVIALGVVTFIYVLFHPSTRYRSPADPFLFILSALAAVELWRWLCPRLQTLHL